jgi:hypothetical protein
MTKLTKDTKSESTKNFSEHNEEVVAEVSQDIYSLDEIINIITDTLAEADGELIAQIANDVLAGEFTYDGDSIVNATWNEVDPYLASSIVESEFKKLVTDTAILSLNDLGEISFVFDELSADDKITNEQILSFHSDLISQIEFYGDQPDADFTAFEAIEEASAVLLSTLPDDQVKAHLNKPNNN